MYSWIQNNLFQRSARVRFAGQTNSLVKIREGVPQGGVMPTTLFILFIDDICDQLSSHVLQALHADNLAIWTKAEQVTAATTRMQFALNLLSNLAKEVVGNNQENYDRSHLFLHVSQETRVHPAYQLTRTPPARHPSVPRSEVRQKTSLVPPHQYHAQQSSQENSPDEETGTK